MSYTVIALLGRSADKSIAFASIQNLKTLFDAVAWIDFDLFTSSVRQLVMSTLDSVDSGSSSLDWKDVEVALFALYMFGEPASKGQSRELFDVTFTYLKYHDAEQRKALLV